MTTTETSRTADFSQTDFCDPRVFDDPYELFDWLRSLDHLHYDAKNDLYIAARHEDVFAISRDDDLYCCKYGVRPKIAGDMSIITLDGDEHTRQRRLINKGFTPRRVRELIPHIRQLTNEIIDQIADRGHIDFVEDFAIHVPLIVICELMGLPPEQRLDMYRWSDDMMAGDGHVEADSPQLIAAAEAFGEYCTILVDLIAEKRGNPKDDLISILTRAFDAGDITKEFKAYQGVSEEELAKMAEADSEQLKDDELLAFLTVLLVAGNETTRNAITGGFAALSRFPKQKQLMLDHIDDEAFMDLAADELVRFVTPVIGFIRTVTRAHAFHNTALKEGDRILMLYGAANRDSAAFTNPDELDLTRDPNPHLGFGIGAHFCLGSNLARAEIKTVFQELFRRLPDITVPEGIVPGRGDSTLVLALQDVPADYSACPVAH
ncbi:MAG: cytochrome P450 [Microthrixaceae bacterium]|nr:cytochrome P450 [Microthrixaceae bacterium]